MTTPTPQPQDQLKLRDTPSPYISLLIEQLPDDYRPNPLPACASCPASMWRADHQPHRLPLPYGGEDQLGWETGADAVLRRARGGDRQT